MYISDLCQFILRWLKTRRPPILTRPNLCVPVSSGRPKTSRPPRPDLTCSNISWGVSRRASSPTGWRPRLPAQSSHPGSAPGRQKWLTGKKRVNCALLYSMFLIGTLRCMNAAILQILVIHALIILHLCRLYKTILLCSCCTFLQINCTILNIFDGFTPSRYS